MELSEKRAGLTGTQLKTIALVLMVLDHIHYFFAFTGAIPEAFSMAARMSAPLFLFCTVEGFAHTHDRRRYVLRIWSIGAGMAAVEFFMIYGGWLRRGDGFYPENAIFQDLMLLCILWQGIDWLRQKCYVRGGAAIGAVVLWPFVVAGTLSAFPQIVENPTASTVAAFVITSPLPMWTSITDGGWSFLAGGVLLYALRSKKRSVQVAVWAAATFGLQFGTVILALRGTPGFALSQMFTMYYEWFSVGAAMLMLCYNGQRGSGSKKLFYIFYPAHIYLLYALSCWVYTVFQ